MSTFSNPDSTVISELRELLGEHAVLIPLKSGQKFPQLKGWQDIRVEKMSDHAYINRLSNGNIGVLLGQPSSGLCSIDIDDDAEIEPFLSLNPKLKNTLRTRGSRGENIWVKIRGKHPPLTPLARIPESGSSEPPRKWGEWRSTGGQTVVYGMHPSGSKYKIVENAKPLEIEFKEIVWPAGLNLPWDLGSYSKLVEEQGEPYYASKGSELQLNDNFFVAKFDVENVLLYEPAEHRFYDYSPERGLWLRNTNDSIKKRFSDDLKRYADSQSESRIERKRTNGYLNGLTDLLKGQAERPNAFAQANKPIHLANGMLHLELSPPELREFSPMYYSRNQCPLHLVEGADCPRFKTELLASALDTDDISLLQRWSGSVLLGGNSAHRIMILKGTAGGGKSTVLEIIERILGTENIVELRTEHLGERFEIYRYLGKTFLTGKDVPAEFLMRKGASTLKKLVGHDLLSAEGKGKNEVFEVRGSFDVAITCNSQLKVRLEGDADAWRRRLMIVDYSRPKSKNRISDFASELVREEGNGILMWMIKGAMNHLKELRDGGDFVLTEKQSARVEALLAESDSVREFVRTCVKVSEAHQSVTVEQLVYAYQEFCNKNDWHPVAPASVERQLPELILTMHGISKRNDIKSDDGTQRGFKGIECDTTII